MVKRILGFILFLWMAASRFGLLQQIGGHRGTQFYTELGIGVVLFALAGIGLLLAFGNSKTRPPADESGDPDTPHMKPLSNAVAEVNPYKPPMDQPQGPPIPRMTFGSYVGAAVDIIVWIALLLIGIGLIGGILVMLGIWR